MTTTNKRDWRTDPQPGDVVQMDGTSWRRVVVEVGEEDVRYKVRYSGMTQLRTMFTDPRSKWGGDFPVSARLIASADGAHEVQA